MCDIYHQSRLDCRENVTHFLDISGLTNRSTISPLMILSHPLSIHCILLLSPSFATLPARYSVQQSTQKRCSQPMAMVILSKSSLGKSQQQMGHSKGPLDRLATEGLLRFIEAEELDFAFRGRARGDWGKGRVDWLGDDGGDRPASWNTPAGSFQNCSCNFSEFQT
jgi:hypothetical protein